MSWAGDDTLPIGDNDSSMDDIEDIIPTSQPKSLQSAASFESSNSRRIEETIPVDDEFSAIIDDTIPVFGNKTPVLNPLPGYIPDTETRPKRKYNDSEFSLASKKLLSNTGEVKDSEDIFSTQPFTVPDSPSIVESQLNSIIDSQLNSIVNSQLNSVVNETASQIDSQTCVNLMSNNNSSNDILMSDASITEIFMENVSKETIEIDSSKSSKIKSSDNSMLEIKISTDDSNKLIGDDIELSDSPLRFIESSNTLPVLNSQQLEEELPKIENKYQDRPGTNDTIDAHDCEYPPVSPFSKRSVEDFATMSTIPAVSGSTSSLSSNHQVQQKKNFGGTQKLLKKLMSDKSPELQKHSTPENPMAKSLDINESTSSIENVTPDAASNSREGNKYTVSFNFKLVCEVEIDPETKTVNKKTLKKIINLDKPKKMLPPVRYIEPVSNSSDGKNRLSSSSSGSVFSDKANLPFKLPNNRLSSQTESSGSVDELENHVKINSRTCWTNEYLIPMEMDEVLFAQINDIINERNESADSFKRKTPTSSKRPKGRRKIHQQTLPDVSESTNTEDFLSDVDSHLTDQNSGVADGKNEAEVTDNSHVEEKVNVKESSAKNEAEATTEKSSEDKEEKEEISEENKTPEKEDDSNVETFSSGLPVFARWSDLRYYSGVLVESAKYDRWNVKFDDGTSKAIKEEFIIPTQWLKKGELILALVNDKYEQGRIKNINKISGEFTIELDSTSKDLVINKSDLCLTENQAGIVKEKFPPLSKATPGPKADIDLDNVVSGKRTREPRTPIRNISLQIESASSKKRSATKSKSSGSDTPVTKRASTSAKKTETPVEVRSTRRGRGKSEEIKNETPDNITPVKTTSGKPKAKAKSLIKDFDASTSSPLPTVPEESTAKPSGNEKVSDEPIPGPSKASVVPKEPTPGPSGVKRGRPRKITNVVEETKPPEKISEEVEDPQAQIPVPETRKGKRKIKEAEPVEIKTDEEAPKKTKTSRGKSTRKR